MPDPAAPMYTVPDGSDEEDQHAADPVLYDLNTLPGDAGQSARYDFTQMPLAGETDTDVAARNLQADRQTQYANSQKALYGRVKAADLNSRGIPSYQDDSGDVKEYTDSTGAPLTGAPLTNSDTKNKVAYDSAGNAVKYDNRNPTKTPTVTDAYADAPSQTDAQGNVYKTPAGLPWQWQGTDPAAVQAAQDKVNQQTQSALDPIVRQAKQAMGAANTAVAQSAKAIQSSFSQSGINLTDDNGEPINLKNADGPTIRKAIEDSTNAQFAAPEANERPFFGGGAYSTTAQQLRDQIQTKKEQAIALANGHVDLLGQRDDAAGAYQQLQSQQSQLEQERLAAVNQKRQSVGLAAIPGINEDTQTAQQPSIPGLNTQPKGETDNATVRQAVTDAQNGQKPYQFDPQKGLSFTPGSFADGIKQAAADGLIDSDKADSLADKAQAADKAYAAQAKLLENDTVASKLKALGVGATKGAAFLAGAPAGAGVGAEIGSALGPVGTTAGGIIGGLVTGGLASYGASALLKKLGQYSDTIKSFQDASEAHPYYDAAGNLVSMGTGVPKAAMSAIGEGLSALAPEGEGLLSKGVNAAAKGYEGAGGGLADTIQNLSNDAKIRAAQGVGPGGQAAAIGARVGGAAAANAVVDTVIKEGAKALGLSDQGQTLSGAAQAGLVGAFLSGHGLSVKDYSPEEVGDILTRQRNGQPLTPQETEAANAAATEINRAINTGKFNPDSTVSVQQGLFNGKNYGVSAGKTEGSEPNTGLTGGEKSVGPNAPTGPIPGLGGPSAPETPEAPTGTTSEKLAQMGYSYDEIAKMPDSEAERRVRLGLNKPSNAPAPTGKTEAPPTVDADMETSARQKLVSDGMDISAVASLSPKAAIRMAFPAPRVSGAGTTNFGDVLAQAQANRPVAEQLREKEAAPSPVEDKETLETEQGAILRQGATTPELRDRLDMVDRKLANLADDDQAKPQPPAEIPTPSAGTPTATKPASSSALPVVREAQGASTDKAITPAATKEDKSLYQARAYTTQEAIKKAENSVNSLPENRKELLKNSMGEGTPKLPGFSRIQKKLDELDNLARNGQITEKEWKDSVYFQSPNTLLRWGHPDERPLTTQEARALNRVRDRVLENNAMRDYPKIWPLVSGGDLPSEDQAEELNERGLWGRGRRADWEELSKESNKNEPTTQTKEENAIRSEGAPVPRGANQLEPVNAPLDEPQRGETRTRATADSVTKHLGELRNGDLKPDFEQLKTELTPVSKGKAGPAGISAHANKATQRIEIPHSAEELADSHNKVQDNWEGRGLTPAEASRKADTAIRSSLEEELIHGRQLIFEKGAPLFEKTYGDLWKDVPAGVKKDFESVRSTKGENDHQKMAELERMIIQYRHTGTITEATFGQDTRDEAFEKLKPFLAGDHSQALEENISRVESMRADRPESIPGVDEDPLDFSNLHTWQKERTPEELAYDEQKLAATRTRHSLGEIYSEDPEAEKTFPAIREREERWKLSHKGAGGKLGEMARHGFMDKAGNEVGALADDAGIRSALGLPKMPEYISAEDQSQQAKNQRSKWSAAAQHTMDALADYIGENRSSEIRDRDFERLSQLASETNSDESQKRMAHALAAVLVSQARTKDFLDSPAVQREMAYAEKESQKPGGINLDAVASTLKKLKTEFNAKQYDSSPLPKGDKDLTEISDHAIDTWINELKRPGAIRGWLSRFRDEHEKGESGSDQAERSGSDLEQDKGDKKLAAAKPITPSIESGELTPSSLLSTIRSYATRNPTGSEGDASQAIAEHIRGNVAEGEEGSRDEQKRAVAEWARENGLALSRLPKSLDFNSERNVGGTEHDVWPDGPSNRWVKVTKPSFGLYPGVKNGKWTLSVSTPAQYLEKIQGTKEQFGIDTPIHGVLLDVRGNPSFIVSQPDVNGKAIDDSEIERHMSESGFEKISDQEAAYYNPESNTAILDAHPGNLVEKGGKLIGFDAIVVHPKGELKEIFKRDYESAQRRNSPVSSTGSFMDRARAQMQSKEESPTKLNSAKAERDIKPIVDMGKWNEKGELVGSHFFEGLNNREQAIYVSAHEEYPTDIDPYAFGHDTEHVQEQVDFASSFKKDAPSTWRNEADARKFSAIKEALSANDPEAILDMAGDESSKPTDKSAVDKASAKLKEQLGYLEDDAQADADATDKDLEKLHEKAKEAWKEIKKRYPRFSDEDFRDLNDLSAEKISDRGISLSASKPMRAYQKEAKKIQDEFAASGVRDKISGKIDAGQNIAAYRGEHVRNSIKADFPDVKDDEAMPFVIEAGGSKAKLKGFAAKVAASTDPALAKKYAPIVEHSLSNFDRLDKLKANHDDLMAHGPGSVADLKANGIEPPEVQNYVEWRTKGTQADEDAMPNPLFAMGSGKGPNPRYITKDRAFDTLADAIQAGQRPTTTKLSSLDGSRIQAGVQLIENKKFYEKLMATPSPTDGKPIVGKMINGQIPTGYQIVNMDGKAVPVHKMFAGLMSDLYGTSGVRNNVFGRAALKFAAATKHLTLVFDTFHVARMLFKQATGAGISPVTGRATSKGTTPGWNIHKGLSILEHSDKDLDRMQAAGALTKDEVQYARANRKFAEELLGAGLNVGKVSDDLMDQAKLHIPGLTRMTDWIFKKLSRGAMLQTAIEAYKRNLKTMPQGQAARQTAKEMNEYFGNLQSQGIFKNKTLQDIARLLFLAPNWVESQFRYEGRAYGQAGKAAYRAARGGGGSGSGGKPPGAPSGGLHDEWDAGTTPPGAKNRFQVGNAARAMAAGLVALLVANQVINYITRGKSTFQNDEDGLKLDAWLPGGRRGFFFNPFEIAGEYAHAAFKYLAQHQNPVDVAGHIASNKLSPLARGASEAITGRDSSGKHFLNATDRFRSALVDALPSPLPLGGILEKDPRQLLGYRMNRQPGSLEKQALQMGGLKMSPAESPRSTMYALAQPFRSNQAPSDHASEYGQLRQALDNNNMDAAKSELQWLQGQGKTTDQIEHALGLRKDGTVRPEQFTGGAASEAKFINSLTPSQRTVYQQAQSDHQANARKFIGIARSAPMLYSMASR